VSHCFCFQDDQNLIVISFTGEISPEEEVQAVNDVLADPRMKPNSKILVDKTEAQMTVTPKDVAPHVELILSNQAKFGRPRVANVVSRDYDFGMTRMLEFSSSDVIPHDFMVFRSLADACEWLEIDPAKIVWPNRETV
jgi:hypothetical protein